MLVKNYSHDLGNNKCQQSETYGPKIKVCVSDWRHVTCGDMFGDVWTCIGDISVGTCKRLSHLTINLCFNVFLDND